MLWRMYLEKPARPPNVATVMGRKRWLRKSHCCRQNERYSQLVSRRPEIGQPRYEPNTIISRSANQVGGGEAHEDEDGGRLVEARVLACGREDADGDRERKDDRHLDHVQQQRDGQALGDLLEHGPAVGRERPSEIEPGEPGEPVPVLHREWLVEPVLLPQHLLGLRAGVGAEIAGVEVDRIA